MNELLAKCLGPLHRKYRRQKCDMFFSELNPSPSDSLLDVGGDGGSLFGAFASLYRFFGCVQVANVCPQSFSQNELHHVRCDIADGCALPYVNNSFDWVFSNAVIEHVGDRFKQLQFAAEIRRVARKGYFVATPNRYFPLDPHTLLPFYHFMSPEVQRLACRFSVGYLREYEPVDLLSKRDLIEMFPGATVRHCGLALFPNNLVVYRATASPTSSAHCQCSARAQ